MSQIKKPMRTITLRFIGGLNDGLDLPWVGSPPPFVEWVDGSYTLDAWLGDPDWVALYKPTQKPLWNEPKAVGA